MWLDLPITLARKATFGQISKWGRAPRDALAARNVAAEMIQRVNVPEDVPGTCLSRYSWPSDHDDERSVLTTGDRASQQREQQDTARRRSKRKRNRSGIKGSMLLTAEESEQRQQQRRQS